jgi:hypothetical protein
MLSQLQIMGLVHYATSLRHMYKEVLIDSIVNCISLLLFSSDCVMNLIGITHTCAHTHTHIYVFYG